MVTNDLFIGFGTSETVGNVLGVHISEPTFTLHATDNGKTLGNAEVLTIDRLLFTWPD